MGSTLNGTTGHDGATLTLPGTEKDTQGKGGKVKGGGMSRSASIAIHDGKTVKYQMYFSSLGIFGGGRNFKPA